MQHKWLKMNGASRLTIFFLGWSTDDNCLTATPLDIGTDIVALFDFADGDAGIDTGRYDNVDIVAWSMGVFAAERFVGGRRGAFGRLTAVNGTPRPADALFGIDRKMVQATRDNWSEASRQKFLRRMCGTADAGTLQRICAKRDIENQRDELTAILAACAEPQAEPIMWDNAIVGRRDMIFRPKTKNAIGSGTPPTSSRPTCRTTLSANFSTRGGTAYERA